MNMKTFFVGIILLALLAGCTQQGGYGGGGEGSDSTKGLKTGTAKSENQDVNTNTGNVKGTIRPDGTVTSNTVNGAK
jgi:hypothetical protein